MSQGTVWLVSYPKSGNTWFRALWAGWSTGGAPQINDLPPAPLPVARDILDAALMLPTGIFTRDEIDLLRPRADEVVAAEAPPAHDHPLLRKVHDAFFPGPAGEPVVSVAASRAVVYLVRDPRDVAVSLAHHAGRSVEWAAAELSDSGATISGADRSHAQVRQRLGTWSQHVESWVDQGRIPVKVVRYEALIADSGRCLTDVLQWLGYQLARDRASAIAEAASFSQLRLQEDRSGFGEASGAQPRFFREGRAGAWRDELPAGISARIEGDHRAVMSRFGYLGSCS
jgi:hypothetical protein